ncbi:BrxA family protein [uncultured Thiodictyon sp.]|uniref:BrxA family protein n=1 Tax=uncultured Thiodictyon sp. TaxID=1846217 RepID=UPI0025E0804E|nr:BrxA family protein [uncultured Thiodictyon sp.]
MTHDGRYQANFTKGGLMVPESRRVAELLLAGVDAAGWKQAIEGDNLLRKRSPTTASTKALLIRARLRTMTEGLWRLVRDGDRPVATQALFAATITYSVLLDLHKPTHRQIQC